MSKAMLAILVALPRLVLAACERGIVEATFNDLAPCTLISNKVAKK